jgi:adenylate cyclase
MAREIERKFLLAGDGWRRQVRSSEAMRQGYLSESEVSVRVRMVGASQAWLNIKAGGFVASRLEFDYEIPAEDARELLALCRRPLVEKIRHHVYVDDQHWEIDEFLGANAGLIVAEIELDSETRPVVRPDWLGQEVTEQRRYYNVCLIDHPFEAWSEAERCHLVR